MPSLQAGEGHPVDLVASAIPYQELGQYDIPEKPELTVISIFTGCGGFDCGTGQAGWKTRVMVEWDKNCCDTLRANFTKAGYEKYGNGRPPWPPRWCPDGEEPAILQADITKTSTDTILKAGRIRVGEAMLLTGGFPCQGYSHAGKRLIDDPRNKLYKECVRVIRESLPKFFVLENVPGLMTMANGLAIKQICEDLVDSGYDLVWDILDAADYGVPQHRRRIFFMGTRIDTLIHLDGMERPQLHMATCRGTITWPECYRKKYPHLATQNTHGTDDIQREERPGRRTKPARGGREPRKRGN